MTPKHSPKLPANFRYIRPTDCDLELKSGDSRMDKYTLTDYYRWSLQQDNLVILRTKRGTPLAVMRLIIRGGYISLDMLASNQNYQHQGLGTEMLTLLGKIIAPFFDKTEVRLEALSVVVN